MQSKKIIACFILIKKPFNLLQFYWNMLKVLLPLRSIKPGFRRLLAL